LNFELHAGGTGASVATLSRSSQGSQRALGFAGFEWLPFCLTDVPFKPFTLPSPLLDRDDIGRPEPSIPLTLPRCLPVLLREDQLAPEGILVPFRKILVHACLPRRILLLRVEESSKRDLMARLGKPYPWPAAWAIPTAHSLGHVAVLPQYGACHVYCDITTTGELAGNACLRGRGR